MVEILQKINLFVWGAPALLLILGIGVYLSLSTGFVQLKFLPRALRMFGHKLRKKDDHSGVSSYQTLCTALAATVGTGNVAGVAGAIAIGGPGAIFWLWVSAIFGMITKFAEATLAVHFQKPDGRGGYVGGPMLMIERGMGSRWRPLAVLYCFFGVVAACGVGNATQVNAVLDGFNSAVEALGGRSSQGLNVVLGGVLAVITAVCLLGGAKRIGRIAEKLVPIAAVSYVIMGLVVLVLCADRIDDAFAQIFVCAFSPKAATGGVVFSAFQALRTGVSRGVFTNEAGMGTASISYASARVGHCVEQGLMGIVEVFVDTIVICTITALVILCSGVGVIYGVDEGAALTSMAFGLVYGNWIQIPIALFLCCFAFATMLGWGLYGARCAQYLFGDRAWRWFAILQGLVVAVSSVMNTGTIWLFAEIVNGLMAIPNLIALAYLSPVLFKLIDQYKNKFDILYVRGGTYENFYQL